MLTLLKKIGWALLAFMVAACNPFTSTPSPNKISFMVFGDPAELAAYQTLVEAFKGQYPEIGVDLIHIPGQSDYRQRLAADFAAGTPADVVLINYRRLAGFTVKGALEPLGSYLEKSAVLEAADFYAPALNAFQWQGRQICIPQNISSLVVYYNKKLFDAAGVAYPKDDWTWDDFLATALALTQDTDGDGVTDRYGLGVEPELIRVAPFIWQNNGDLATIHSLTLGTPEALAAVQWFVDLQVKHHVAPGRVEEEAESSESRFQNGRTAMYLNSRRITPTLREAAAFDWDVAPLPHNIARATILHSDAYCLAQVSRNKDAAWTFIEFANSVEGQTIIAAAGRTVPSLKAVAESPAFLDPEAKPAHSQIFLDEIPYLFRLPLVPGWADVEEIASAEIQRAFYGEATVEEAMNSAVVRTVQFFGENE
jgi:multiple sugar transport system substrate-binding protein